MLSIVCWSCTGSLFTLFRRLWHCPARSASAKALYLLSEACSSPAWGLSREACSPSRSIVRWSRGKSQSPGLPTLHGLEPWGSTKIHFFPPGNWNTDLILWIHVKNPLSCTVKSVKALWESLSPLWIIPTFEDRVQTKFQIRELLWEWLLRCQISARSSVTFSRPISAREPSTCPSPGLLSALKCAHRLDAN